MLSTIEGGAAVAGIGLFSLYLRRGRQLSPDGEYYPVFLGAAALVHSAYLPFLGAHAIGVLVKRLVGKRSWLPQFNQMRLAPLLAKAALLLLMLTVVLLPSSRPDQNHMVMDPKYVPIPLKNPLAIGFFQIADGRHAAATTPKSKLIYADWYFTHRKTFGDATTILQALKNRPERVAAQIRENIGPAFRAPVYILLGNGAERFKHPLISVISWVILAAGALALLTGLKEAGRWDYIFSISFGSVALFIALLLTWFSGRYMALWLPVGLLALVNVGSGINLLNRRRSAPTNLLDKADLVSARLTTFAISALAVCLLFGAGYAYSKRMSLRQALGYDSLLAQQKTRSMVSDYPTLLGSVNKDTKVLALEDHWLKGFTDIDLDNIYQIWSLPPFPDRSGKTRTLLNNLDAIWVSPIWSKKQAVMSTQMYLRYRIHVLPFLKEALAAGWTVKEVEGYGKIFRRPSVD